MTSLEKFVGVSIKKFPAVADHGDIPDLLIESGLPEIKKEEVQLSHSGTVTIRDFDSDICSLLIHKFHGKLFFNRKIFCT